MTSPQLIPLPPQTQAQRSTTFCSPPLDGSLTLPQTYDWQFHQSPAHRLFVFTDNHDKLNTITWSEGVAAMYTGARVLRNRLSSVHAIRRPVVAILSTSVGHDSAMESLLEDSLHLLGIKTFDSTDSSMRIPTFSSMLTFEDLFLKDVNTKTEASDLPLKHTDPNEIAMYLHSSGSTAFPKPIPWTNHRLVQLMHIPWYGDQDLTDQVWSLHAIPMYHGIGVFQLCWTASSGLVVASFAPRNPAVLATPENLFLAAKATNSEIILSVPSFIEAWAKEPEYIQWLSTCNGVLYGGGPLNKDAGDLLTRNGVSIYILYGATEGGIMSPVIPDCSASSLTYPERLDRRQAILNDYDGEIKKLYQMVDESTQATIPPPEEWNLNSTLDFVRVVLTRVLQRDLNDNDDIFEYGCDSLQATWIRNTLLRALRQSAEIDSRNWTMSNFVYEYPTVDKLSRFLVALTDGTWSMQHLSNIEVSKQKVRLMEAMVDKYSSGLPSLNMQQHSDRVILVTGTTGALGCHILTTLLADEQVSRIYALNRKQESFTPLERQIQAFTEREMDPEELRTCRDKLMLLDADLTRDGFGIDLNIYQDGLHNLISFSLTSGAQLIYTSTIGVFQNIEAFETLKENWVSPEVAVGMGYTESKWVSEELIRSSMLPNALVVRVGQLTGDTKSGVWNQKEWVPTMIRSATMLGCLPDEPGLVSWIPVDYAAQILVSYTKTKFSQNTTPTILHLAHPNPISWSKIANVIQAELGNVALVRFSEWLTRLEEKSQDAKLPATRLLPFYRALNTRIGSSRNYEAFGMPRVEIEKGMPNNALPSLSGDDVSRWICHWKKLGWDDV
ncbi:acetyl-CoA synthetase-like protein [Dendrothele bispora CBS 962.96]|uniref:Acetyl-CoA synthetase-like protein n=1 Tax=Dendrothele bispora (strain CBS 962.96) TaxID=1314807 RepID=A0A4S8KPH7_DENBC|nr:acetyl-CoA synthetase-like protein [Dendrothele bispora CBS 962.96]